MHGRIYDPVLGEFLTPDPLMQNPLGHGLNAFAYVENQPLDFVDPSGFVATSIFDAAGQGPATQDWFAGHGGGDWAAFSPGLPQGSMGSEATASSFQEGSLSLGLEVMSAVGLGLEIADLVAKSPPPEKSTGLAQSRAAQARGSGLSKPPTGNSTQPTTADLARTALNQAPLNDCTRNPGLCLAAGGEEEGTAEGALL